MRRELNLKLFVFEGCQVVGLPVGPLMATVGFENFLSLSDDIVGPELMDSMKWWGAELVTEDLIEADFSQCS